MLGVELWCVKDVGSCEISYYIICTYKMMNRKKLRYKLPGYLAQIYSKSVSNVDPLLHWLHN